MNEIFIKDEKEIKEKIEEIKKKTEKELKAAHEKEMKLRISISDDEKIELFDQIKELKTELDHYRAISKKYYEAAQDENMKKIKEIHAEYSDKDIVSQEIHKEIIEKRE